MTVSSIPDQVFCADIPNIDISVDGTRAAVIMTADNEQIYSETLYPVDGKIIISDIPDLVHAIVRQKLVVTLNIKITEQTLSSSTNTFVDASSSILITRVVYSAASMNIDCSTFCNSHFLSILLGTKTTASGRLEYLHYLGTDNASCVAEYSDGSTTPFVPARVQGNDNYTTIDVSPDRFVVDGKSLVAYTITAGNRSQYFELDLSVPDCAPILLFSNSFGCQELIYCTGEHQVAPSYNRSAAYIDGKYKNYDIDETRTFKADSGVLNTAMANWLDDLFRSDEIYMVNFYKGNPNIGQEVTITDSKSENNNAPDELPRFTFSYRYSSKNQNIIDLNRAGRIFDNTFDNTFN